VVADNPVEGDQEYEAAPEAVKVVDPPGQIDGLFTETIGAGSTVIVT